MDEKDKELLTRIQQNFPMESRPYLVLARELDITENEVIKRIEGFKNKGYIRRMGAVFNSSKLGYSSTLCAMSVPKNMIKEVTQVINAYDEITHNYIRKHSYNIWFTVIACSKQRLQQIISEIKEKTGIASVLNLPAVRHLKIKVVFDIREVKSYV